MNVYIYKKYSLHSIQMDCIFSGLKIHLNSVCRNRG